MISCGEPSGDLYAGALVRALRAQDRELQAFGLGGECLAAEQRLRRRELRARRADVAQRAPLEPSEVLRPRDAWADKSAYDAKAKELAERFKSEYKKYA